MGARDRLRQHFLANVSKVLSTEELAQVAGIREYARRIRELRNEEGWPIRTHNDIAELKPGEYMLVSDRPEPRVARGIRPDQRARILERNGYTCQMCGAGAGEPDPYDPKRKVRLNIDHRIPISQGGTDDDANLRVICSTCNQGRSNTFVPPSAESINIMSVIRRQPRDIQKKAFRFLANKFRGELEELLKGVRK